jgi:hypothetical protein
MSATNILDSLDTIAIHLRERLETDPTPKKFITI